MTLAVLQARCGLNFADRDVYLNVAGGLRIQEPAVDLAVAAALISSLLDTPLPPRSVVFGETALSGAVRPVARPDLRLKEAEKLGFEHAFVPADETGAQPVLQSRPIARLEALVNVIGDGSPS
jgi:DNA repair protein RadA/Sms